MSKILETLTVSKENNLLLLFLGQGEIYCSSVDTKEVAVLDNVGQRRQDHSPGKLRKKTHSNMKERVGSSIPCCFTSIVYEEKSMCQNVLRIHLLSQVHIG